MACKSDRLLHVYDGDNIDCTSPESTINSLLFMLYASEKIKKKASDLFSRVE